MRRPFLAAGRPIAVAHRGGAEEAPENTLPAFEAALALGYGWIETDVRLTRDGIVVAFHDDRLDRLTDGAGRIADLPLTEVRAADAGFHFTAFDGSHPWRGRGVTVPTLEELLTRFPKAFVNIDAKSDAVVAPLLDLLGRMRGMPRVCLGSFSDARVARIRSLARGRVCTSMGRMAVAIAYAASRTGIMPTLNADCVQVPALWRGVRIADARFVAAAHRAGLPVHVWTVDERAQMEALLDLGVDGIMTDRPRVLRSVMQARGAWAAPARARRPGRGAVPAIAHNPS